MVVWRKSKKILDFKTMRKNSAFRYFIAFLLISFGLITLFMSSSVIFDWFGIREMEGNYVPFVVWANLIASILYIIASFGLIKTKKWTLWVLISAVVILLVAFMGLFVHINLGGLFETKTLGAMVFRISVTVGFAVYARYMLKNARTAMLYRRNIQD